MLELFGESWEREMAMGLDWFGIQGVGISPLFENDERQLEGGSFLL